MGLVIELVGTVRGQFVRRGIFAVLYDKASTAELEFQKRFYAACKCKDVRAEINEEDYEKQEDDSDDAFPQYCISLI